MPLKKKKKKRVHFVGEEIGSDINYGSEFCNYDGTFILAIWHKSVEDRLELSKVCRSERHDKQKKGRNHSNPALAAGAAFDSCSNITHEKVADIIQQIPVP